ncbi:MAG: HAD hydrolase family protein [Candidatus Gastranaerophilales bacterium]|nr:HAD hydrolase family protein [Candidatus Gastranaerophilales bacterium]
MYKKIFPKEQIKMVVSDFDGVFTDGKLTVYSDGTTSKNVDYKDIMAIANIIKQDIKFAIISGETSAAIDIMKSKFPMIDTFQNERKKINVLKSLMEKYNLFPQNIIYIGDDINDIECLKTVAYPATVQDAHISVKEVENIYVSTKNGGYGAFREIMDCIL